LVLTDIVIDRNFPGGRYVSVSGTLEPEFVYDFHMENSCSWLHHDHVPADGGSVRGRIRAGLIYPEDYYDPQEFFGELRRIAPEITIEKTVEVVS
jgi:hypothetical protein